MWIQETEGPTRGGACRSTDHSGGGCTARGSQRELRVVVVFSHLIGSNSFVTPWTAVRQAPQSTLSRSWLKFMSIESVMLSNHLIFCHPLLLPSIFPRSFPKRWLFTSGGQSIGASASESVLPVNIQVDFLSKAGVI